MTIEEMNRRKQELGYSYEMIAKKSGVPVGTVQKVLGGITKTPRYATLMALEKALTLDSGFRLSEEVFDYYYGQPDKYYTIEDYDDIPEGQYAELYEGRIIMFQSPSLQHQDIVLDIGMMLRDYVDMNGGQCRTYVAPIDCRLDDKTVFIPDVAVVCDKNKTNNGKRIIGAPDFVVEVISESTKNKDYGFKVIEYKKHGVREYWVVDYNRKTIAIYDFEHDGFKLYGMKDQVPVAIFNGDLKIDFSKISNRLGVYNI